MACDALAMHHNQLSSWMVGSWLPKWPSCAQLDQRGMPDSAAGWSTLQASCSFFRIFVYSLRYSGRDDVNRAQLNWT